MSLALKTLGLLSLSLAIASCHSAAKAPTTSSPDLTPSALTPTSHDHRLQTMPEQTITQFEQSSEQSSAEAVQWQSVNDNVMGGVSQGELIITAQGTGLFRGHLSLENNGGFSSVRRDASDYDFSDVSNILTRVRGDGRRYQLRVHPRNDTRVIYRAAFETLADQWQTVSVPLSDFEPVFRGNLVPSAPPLSADNISQVGFLIADKKRGSFSLEIDWIAAE